MTPRTLLITGVHGFIGRNLEARLLPDTDVTTVGIGRNASRADLEAAVAQADVVVHLAGSNRPADPEDFTRVNRDFTDTLCQTLGATGRTIPVVFASSIHAERETAYGVSKRAAEDVLRQYAEQTGSPVSIFRLPNVFGKWSRPEYNSAVATFCHNVSRDLPIRVDNPDAPLSLVYIDDVLEAIMAVVHHPPVATRLQTVTPVYDTSVGAVAQLIQSFRAGRESLMTEPVGTGLTRALYSTYVSFLPPEHFSYAIPSHVDPRGTFVEMLKTKNSGQFSFFTARPGITRGGHYHHTKTEKFLVISGTARFRFRHLTSSERHEIVTTGDEARVVDMAPGWVHDITNIGEGELVVMLWANEVFDRARPDTFVAEL